MFQNWQDVNKDQVLNILKKLDDLFVDPNKWIFYPNAIDEKGNEVKTTDPKAVKFSLYGASEMFAIQAHSKPLCDFVDCALREYLNELSSDDLVLGKCEYEDERLLIRMGIEELSK